MPILVTINGSKVELPEATTLQSYLESKGLHQRRLAVAHNGNLVVRKDYATTIIEDGNTLEIVRPVGGG